MSTSQKHAEWLSLITINGAFLSLPVLQRVFPQGLEAHDVEKSRRVRFAFEEWQSNNENRRPDAAIHRAFCDFLLRDTLEYSPKVLLSGADIPQAIRENTAFAPDYVLAKPNEEPRLLIKFLPLGQNIEKPFAADETHKAVTPSFAMQELLNRSGVRLGLITNGARWMLVHSKPGETAGFVTWDTELFLEEKITLQAFRSLLSQHQFFGVAESSTLAWMIDESKNHQQELTEQLGSQVRQAIEVLMRSFEQMDESSGALNANPLDGISERTIYEAATTVMMRLVVLLRVEDAEEDLFGVKSSEVYQKNYAVAPLREQLQTTADQNGEELLDRQYDAWCRLLATFRAVFGGVNHEAFQLLPHGGDLFNPDRFPFLEGRLPGMTNEELENAKPLLVSNRVILHLLNALQIQQVKGEALKLNYSSLDVERIGNVYEGLLDHTARRAPTDLIELDGKDQPIIALDTLEAVRDKGTENLFNFLVEQTKRSKNAVKKAIEQNINLLDAFELTKLRVACQNDEELFQTAQPYFHLIKRDTRGYPIVIRKGSLYVSAGEDRRSTGTHYTPANLTAEVVKYTLEPLCYEGVSEGKSREEWKLKSAKEILKLKICDVACGSGAFLVQACRYLGERLTEAWDAIERQNENQIIVTPEGAVSSSATAERIIPIDLKERLVTAKRFVADRCLYGVDRNRMAVEMAKISLWLETLQKNKPFTFLDHSIRSGDSLLGVTNLEQFENFGLETGKGTQIRIAAGIYANLLKETVAKRLELESIASDNVLEIERKERLLGEAEKAARKVRLIADLLVGFSLETAGKRKKVWSTQGKQAAEEIEAENLEEVAEEEDTLETLVSEAVKYWQKIDLNGEAADESENPFATNPISEIQEQSARLLGKHEPFHWLLEFPEVFFAKTEEKTEDQKPKTENRVGFDAVVSNPPFMGGKKITGNLGTDYRDFLVEFLASGQTGSADLIAYFFLRVINILKTESYAGLVATNTIAQGDTREVGLDQIVADGATIYRAVSSRKWEGTATLEVSFVWLKKSDKWFSTRILDNKRVGNITSLLTEKSRVSGKPFRLKANENKSFQGSVILGIGFVITPDEASELIAKDERNQQVLYPFLGGEDLNSRPDQSPSRWVINFDDYPMERISEEEWSLLTEDEREQQAKIGRVAPNYSKPVAKDFPDCFRIVVEKVKPQRDLVKRAAYKEKWWRFAERCSGLYNAIEEVPRKEEQKVLAFAQTSKTKYPVYVPVGLVYAQSLVVITFNDNRIFSLLCSHIHYWWVLTHGSSLKTDAVYTPTDCFETFPFPELTDELEQIGAQYHEFRREIMLNRQEGLTQTYNRFHNERESAPDIARLRELHIAMDSHVKLAYGWQDLELAHGFHQTKQGIRFTISPEARQEVLD
ncbi:MAG TPA: DNA methyltransferase, partial [Pyrinomonadaceae bacterium]|nr:DNA methyltransferase [Pyrinomonadaceae bacterium]